MIDLNELTVNKRTKKYIFSKISNNDIIMHFYSGEIIINKKITSPFPSHEDKNPSFIFYLDNNGDIVFHDFGIGLHGSAFDFVMEMFNVSFPEAIEIILVEFGLEKGNKPVFKESNIRRTKNFKVRERASIGFKKRQFYKHDIMYWNLFGINTKTLSIFNVFPIEYIFIGDKSIKADKYSYAYVELIDGVYYTKIYQPYSKELKWVSNMPAKVLFGYIQIPKTGKLLIITKAQKEIMSLYTTLRIPAVAMQSESIIINEEVLKDFKQRFDKIITLFDNDRQGRLITESYNELGFKSILLDEAKNYSDLIEEIGIEKSKEILIKKLNSL